MPETLRMSRDLLILVEQSTGPVVPEHYGLLVHGSMRSSPRRSKSLVLRVARLAWWVLQTAAIWASKPLIGDPQCSRSTTMSA